MHSVREQKSHNPFHKEPLTNQHLFLTRGILNQCFSDGTSDNLYSLARQAIYSKEMLKYRSKAWSVAKRTHCDYMLLFSAVDLQSLYCFSHKSGQQSGLKRFCNPLAAVTLQKRIFFHLGMVCLRLLQHLRMCGTFGISSLQTQRLVQRKRPHQVTN